jgi:hypothetical protein
VTAVLSWAEGDRIYCVVFLESVSREVIALWPLVTCCAAAQIPWNLSSLLGSRQACDTINCCVSGSLAIFLRVFFGISLGFGVPGPTRTGTKYFESESGLQRRYVDVMYWTSSRVLLQSTNPTLKKILCVNKPFFCSQKACHLPKLGAIEAYWCVYRSILSCFIQ